MYSSASPALRAAAGALALGLAGAIAAGLAVAVQAPQAFALCAAVCILGGVAYLVWHADPAWTLSTGLLLSVFSGNWDQIGIPTAFAPDRIVLVMALVAIMLRAPGARGRPRLRFRPVHWVLVVAVAFAMCSAAASGTLLERAPLAVLLERYGVIPFLVFLCAPVAFRTERQRRVLLAALVALGAYLGLVALFEALGAKSLIFPRYINDPSIGIVPDRARGPFLEPATFGVALFTCAAACALAYRAWPHRGIRLAVAGIGLLCGAGLLFTLTRQVWVGSVLASVLVALVVPRFRAWLVPAGVVAAAAVVLMLAAVPGLAEKAAERRAQEATVWDRLNLNRAALNAIEDRPLAGVGWESWTRKNLDYFQLSPNYPLTDVIGGPVHNVFLAYAAQIGLVGVTVWVLGLLMGIGGSLLRRGPPDIQPWRVLLLAVFGFFVVVATFEFVQVFPYLVLWLLAGLVAAPAFWAEHDAARLARRLPADRGAGC